MDQAFTLEEIRLMYSLVHECIFMNNDQLDNDSTISADTRNSIIDENKVAMRCWRKLRAVLTDVSPDTLKVFDESLPPLR